MFDTGPAVVYISLDEVDSMHERARRRGRRDPHGADRPGLRLRETSWPSDHEGNVWCFGTYQPGR